LETPKLLLDTGARLNEICSLEWRHVNMVQGFIELFREKVGNESIIHLTDRCRKVINERFIERDWTRFVFPARKVKNAHRTCVGALRKDIQKVCGPEFTIHSLRHTCATPLAQAGMNMYELQNQLGHPGSAMTQKYAHLAVADVSKKARNMLNRKG
jgi:integrase